MSIDELIKEVPLDYVQRVEVEDTVKLYAIPLGETRAREQIYRIFRYSPALARKEKCTVSEMIDDTVGILRELYLTALKQKDFEKTASVLLTILKDHLEMHVLTDYEIMPSGRLYVNRQNPVRETRFN